MKLQNIIQKIKLENITNKKIKNVKIKREDQFLFIQSFKI